MPDTELDQLTSGDAPAIEPASTTAQVDLKAIQDALAGEFDKRFGGIQSMTDRKFSELQRTIEELRAANLTPEEQEQFEITQAKNRAAALERENALLKMRKQYPEEVDFLEAFFGAKSLDEQLTALAGFRKAPAPEVTTDPEVETTPTPVNGNNAPRRATPTVSDASSGGMTEALADQILGSAGNEKGILKRLLSR